MNFFKRFKRCNHDYVLGKNWAILDGNLVCLRVYSCSKCDYEDKALFLVASKEDLAEAQTKVIESNK